MYDSNFLSLVVKNIKQIRSRKLMVVLLIVHVAIIGVSPVMATGFGAVVNPSQVGTDTISIGVVDDSLAESLVTSGGAIRADDAPEGTDRIVYKQYETREQLTEKISEREVYAGVISSPQDSSLTVVTEQSGIAKRVTVSKIVNTLKQGVVNSQDTLSPAEKTFITDDLLSARADNGLLQLIILPVLFIGFPILSGVFVIDSLIYHRESNLLTQIQLTPTASYTALSSIALPGILLSLCGYTAGTVLLTVYGFSISSLSHTTILFISLVLVSTVLSLVLCAITSLDRMQTQFALIATFSLSVIVPNPLLRWESAIEMLSRYMAYEYVAQAAVSPLICAALSIFLTGIAMYRIQLTSI